MSSPIALITGCTSGLGFECVKSFAQNHKQWRVILACRNPKAANDAAEKICKETGAERDNFIVLETPLNLASLASVREYFTALCARSDLSPIVALVNNAGIAGNFPRRMTVDGYEEIFQTNHLGHFLLTILFLKLLRTSKIVGTTIINVASEVHDPANTAGISDPGVGFPDDVKLLAIGDPNPQESELNAGGRRYSRSKLCNILFTIELARRLQEDKHITVTSYNPGLMLETDIFRGFPWLLRSAVYILRPLLRVVLPFVRNASDSGRILASLAAGKASTNLAKPIYYSSDVPSNTSELSKDVQLQTKLWTASIELAHVTENELKEAGLQL